MPYKKLITSLFGLAMLLAACQTQTEPVFEAGTASAAVESEAMAEARAFGTAQGVAGIAASFDPTGASSVPLMIGGRAAHAAWMRSVHERLKAAQEVDDAAFLKRHGMNPDGTPSGKPGFDLDVP